MNMSKQLRRKILEKIAQTQPAQLEEIIPNLAPPPNLPSDLFATLNQGYNANTVAPIVNITSYLNTALYYASNGKDSMQKIANNNMDLSGATSDHKNIGVIAKKVFETFLNRKNPFIKKVAPALIHQWCNAIIALPEYNNLTQIKASSNLAVKLQVNLKNVLLDYLNSIKSQNPITS